MSVFKCLTWTTRLDKILDEVQPGDSVRFHRGLFIHHAVYVGDGRAVHHHLGPSDGEVIEATLEYLAKGDLMKVFQVTDTVFSRKEIVQRARSQIGPLPYSLHGGNCEHFTTWVYYGIRESKQLNSLCQYQLRLLQVVKHNPNPDAWSLQKQRMSTTCSTDAAQDSPASACTADKTASSSKIDHSEDQSTDASFEFVPPRPVKYRPAKNSAQLALNHTRSCLKVLAVQAVVNLAAVPLYRCGLQADNLRRLGRQLRAKSSRNVKQTSDAESNVSENQAAIHATLSSENANDLNSAHAIASGSL